MQTFLPYADYAACVRALDTKRLGKQRVEVLQILNALQNPDAKGWRNHPATLMWKAHQAGLIRYGVAICDEWQARGFKDTVRQKLLDRVPLTEESGDPEWLGLPELHASHRANLLRKDPEFYGRHGWTDDPDLEYHWPAARVHLPSDVV